MKAIILIILSIISFNTNAGIFEIAVRNFSYKADTDGATTLKENLKTVKISNVRKSFSGDCEDFAYSLQRKIGGQVWYTRLPVEDSHMVLVKDGIVYDFYKGKLAIDDYPSRLLYWYGLDGSYGTNFSD